MANYSKIDWSSKASWDLPVYLNRLNKIPLDKTSVWDSSADASAYIARDSSMSYAGQVLSVADFDEGSVSVYKANINRTITELENVDNRVSSWQTTPDNKHYPTEKLVKDTIDELSRTVGELLAELNEV